MTALLQFLLIVAAVTGAAAVVAWVGDRLFDHDDDGGEGS